MGSNWRYRHVAITPYSIGGFHKIACTFFTGSLVLFHGLAFCFDGWAHEFTCRWKTIGSHWSKQKNKLAQLASPIFSQHFPTQVSPHYIQLDPIYYDHYIIKLGAYYSNIYTVVAGKPNADHYFFIIIYYRFRKNLEGCSFGVFSACTLHKSGDKLFQLSTAIAFWQRCR